MIMMIGECVEESRLVGLWVALMVGKAALIFRGVGLRALGIGVWKYFILEGFTRATCSFVIHLYIGVLL